MNYTRASMEVCLGVSRLAALETLSNCQRLWPSLRILGRRFYQIAHQLRSRKRPWRRCGNIQKRWLIAVLVATKQLGTWFTSCYIDFITMLVYYLSRVHSSECRHHILQRRHWVCKIITLQSIICWWSNLRTSQTIQFGRGTNLWWFAHFGLVMEDAKRASQTQYNHSNNMRLRWISPIFLVTNQYRYYT